jgi:phosphatidylglycerol:prolipoprotein diacylglycerol transferase
MRPRILEVLNDQGLGWLTWMVPQSSFMFSLALAAVLGLFLWRSKQASLSTDFALRAAVAATIGALIGTRLFWLLTSGAILRLSPSQWIGQHGTGSWGVYIGAMVGAALYLRFAKMPALPYLDVMASCAALGTFIGRWGCFLAGCDFGRVTPLSWGVQYPMGSRAWAAHLTSGVLPPDAQLSLPVHPLPIYLSLNALFVFLIVSFVWRRGRGLPGRTLAAFWIIYPVTRFLWELLRDPAAGGADRGLSVSQSMCLFALAGGLVLLGLVRRWEREGQAD